MKIKILEKLKKEFFYTDCSIMSDQEWQFVQDAK